MRGPGRILVPPNYERTSYVGQRYNPTENRVKVDANIALLTFDFSINFDRGTTDYG